MENSSTLNTFLYVIIPYYRNLEDGLRESEVSFLYVRARPPRIVLLVEDTNVMNVQVSCFSSLHLRNDSLSTIKYHDIVDGNFQYLYLCFI